MNYLFMGMPRSGSTSLQLALSKDPRFHYPKGVAAGDNPSHFWISQGLVMGDFHKVAYRIEQELAKAQAQDKTLVLCDEGLFFFWHILDPEALFALKLILERFNLRLVVCFRAVEEARVSLFSATKQLYLPVVPGFEKKDKYSDFCAQPFVEGLFDYAIKREQLTLVAKDWLELAYTTDTVKEFYTHVLKSAPPDQYDRAHVSKTVLCPYCETLLHSPVEAFEDGEDGEELIGMCCSCTTMLRWTGSKAQALDADELAELDFVKLGQMRKVVRQLKECTG